MNCNGRKRYGVTKTGEEYIYYESYKVTLISDVDDGRDGWFYEIKYKDKYGEHEDYATQHHLFRSEKEMIEFNIKLFDFEIQPYSLGIELLKKKL